jgi:DNA-binding HxlR family transcriptional regulator
MAMADFGGADPLARALDILGDRWTLLIVRDLVLKGPRRFQDFLTNLPGISASTLSARLRILEDGGVVERRFYLMHPPRAEYLLTEEGHALRQVTLSLQAWGDRYVPPRNATEDARRGRASASAVLPAPAKARRGVRRPR